MGDPEENTDLIFGVSARGRRGLGRCGIGRGVRIVAAIEARHLVRTAGDSIRRHVLVLLVAGFGFLPLVTVADTVHLKSGGMVVGRIVEETSRQVVVNKGRGFTVAIPWESVARVEKTESYHEDYRTRKKKAELAGSPDAFLDLARWCESQDLQAWRDLALSRVLDLDPKNKDAMAALGYGPCPALDEYSGPRRLERPVCELPEDIRARRTSWVVQLECRIDYRGWPERSSVSRSSSDPQIDRAAMACVERSTFHPAERKDNGKPCEVPMVITVQWK